MLCLDNFQTGNVAFLQTFRDHPHLTVLEHDVENSIALDKPVDIIYHLACPASPVHYQADPIRTMRTSVLGTLNVLEVARANQARLVFTSTSEAYGEPLEHPQRESYRGNVNTLGIRACYDEGKRAAETVCMDYHRQFGVSVGIARIFNTYGPRMAFNDGRVVSNFIVQSLRGEKLTVYGDGSQTRSFCYVDDLIDGLVRLQESNYTGPVNLGNDVEFTVRELAEIVQAEIGGNAIEFRPLPADDPTRRCPDLSLAEEILQWRPEVPLRSGIKQTVAEFRRRLHDS